MSEQPGRYQRSFPAMAGAMLVVLGVIGAYVLFREVNRDDLEVEPEPVDYLAVVEGIHERSGRWVAYPPELPAGWTPTVATLGQGPRWSLNMVTEDDDYVGVHQSQRATVGSMVDEYVDGAATEQEPVRLDSPLAVEWRTFTDEGGDHAVVAEVGRSVVLVVGTASPGEVERMAASLVREPLG